MKMQDIVNQLRLLLPSKTDLFSGSLTIDTITVSGEVATISTTDDHDLTTGDAVTLSSVQIETGISAVSQDGLLFTFTTDSDHDLTLGWPDHENVNIDGFTDSAWNSSFKLMAVSNRRTFTVRSVNTIPTLNSNEKLLENRVGGVNGEYSVTVVDDTTFTITGTLTDGDYLGGSVSGGVRVAGTVEIERAIDEYTEQNVTDFWAFVSMHDATISKDRNADSDAIATVPTGTSIRQRLVDGFSIFVVVNTSEQIAGENAVDVCRHDLLSPILKSVFGARFDTGLSGEADFKTIFMGHGLASYVKHTLVYQYEFEVSMDLTDDDAVDPRNTRAFRDIDYTHEIGSDDTDNLEVTIDLDEVPV